MLATPHDTAGDRELAGAGWRSMRAGITLAGAAGVS